MTKTWLITGGAGFIGSNFLHYALQQHPDYHFINLDALTYAGNLENLSLIEDKPNYTFIKGDVTDSALIHQLFCDYPITGVINFAAESHVDRSIVQPDIFLRTNILGTQVLLDNARKHWSRDATDKYCFDYKPGVKFLQVSTDEVYGSLGPSGYFTESSPVEPNSPYAASKSSADLMVRAYAKTYQLPTNITRCSNNYGPYQFPEKLIPLVISNCLSDKPLPVYGDGRQVRDWLHVTDHCSAIDSVFHRGRPGQVYNIGGNNESTNLDLIRLILAHLGKSESLIHFVKDRPGHDRRYAIDNTKMTSELGWTPKYSFADGLSETIEWYLANQDWMKRVISGSYREYYQQMYAQA